MELKPTYLIYEEYKELGGNIDEVSFSTLEYRAEKEVDKHTFNRFRKITEYPTELKMCIYDLIPFVDKKTSNSNFVSSETVGSYSVTKKSATELNKEMLYIIINYLQNVKVNNILVLYRGADTNDN